MILGSNLRPLLAFGVASTAIHTSLPTASYRTLELGGTSATVGFVAASYAVVSLFAAMPIGRTVDRHGPGSFFVGGTSVIAAGTIVNAVAPSVVVLGIGQALIGMGYLSTAVSFQTMTANVRHSDRDRGFARLAVATSMGQLVGPMVSGAVLDLEVGFLGDGPENSALAYIVAAVFAGFAVVVARGLGREEGTHRSGKSSPDGAGPMPSSIGVLARRPGVPQALGIGIAVTTSINLLIVYLPVVGEERDIGPGIVGVLLALRAGAGLLSRLTMTTMLQRLGRRVLLMAAMLVAGLSLVGIATLSSPIHLAIAISIVGFCLGLGAPMTMAWLSMQTPRPDRGTVLALRMMGNRLSQVVMPVTSGGLAILLGPGAIFGMLAGFLFAGSAWVRHSPPD